MAICLDYASKTLVNPEVRKAIGKYFSVSYGNPSSMNVFGLEARHAVEEQYWRRIHPKN